MSARRPLPIALCLLVALGVLAAIAVTTRRSDGPPTRRGDVTQTTPRYGPAAGSVLVAGGVTSGTTNIPETFIRLAGGRSKRFVIVPTNRALPNPDGTPRRFDPNVVLAQWRKQGLRNVTMLHTSNRAVADSPAFARRLRNADAVWFTGGRQWYGVDAFRGTRTHRALLGVLRRGGVIGGNSAGASMLGDLLIRGDTSGSGVLLSRQANHRHGLALLRNVAIDTHADSKKRWHDLAPVLAANPRYLGIEIAEDTAVVVRGDTLQVVGAGKVGVSDATRQGTSGGMRFDLLKAGDVYDLRTLSVVRRNVTTITGPDGRAAPSLSAAR